MYRVVVFRHEKAVDEFRNKNTQCKARNITCAILMAESRLFVYVKVYLRVCKNTMLYILIVCV